MRYLAALLTVTAALAVLLPALLRATDPARGAVAEARLRDSLQRAFEIAAHTGKHAVLCPSSDGHACRRSPDFSGGWIAFLDEDGNREHAPEEMLLLAEAALPADVRLRSTLGRTRVVLGRDGRGARVGFTLCDARGAEHARALVLEDEGRLRRATPAAASVAATCAR